MHRISCMCRAMCALNLSPTRAMMKNIDQFNADGSFKDQAMIEEAEARIAEAKAAAIESTPAEAPAGAVSE